MPHTPNAQLNNQERQAKATVLKSYPIYVAMNLIGKCNARCQFCYYTPDYHDNSIISLSDIKKMSWLKNVSTLDLYGGVGEPLLHPEFCDIVDYLKTQNPGQALHVTTNAQLLTKELSDRLANKLTHMNISINAACKETYEKLMIGCSWDRLMENLRYFQSVNRTTKVTFSYVANTSNIIGLHCLAGIAKNLGIVSVGVSHFSTGGVWYARKEERLPRNASLYYNKELFDHCYSHAQNIFLRAGVSIGGPFPFAESEKPGMTGDCFAPWRTAYINPDPDGKWVSCCCCVNAAHMSLTPFNVKQDFMETWNSDVFQLMRGEVNNHPTALLNCLYCRKHDKVDPENNVSQLEMMIQATRQYYALVGKPLDYRAVDEIDVYAGMIERLGE